MKLEKEMRAYALRNAIDYGEAVVGKVLPKLFNHELDKKDIGKIMPKLNEVIKEVNSMGMEKRVEEFEKFKKFILEKEEKEKTLPEIDVSGLNKVVTRLAPEPSKYNHLGHAMSFLLNYQYAKKYNGKCFLRFEDTNPEKVTQEYVDAMKEDVLDYLDIKVDGIRFVSDDMELLYDYAEKLIEMDKAYICFCDREKMQKFRHEGKECKCRENSKEDNLNGWKKFVEGKYVKGEAVLRIKGDMKSKNHVMRDSVLFRAIPARHYRHGDKYQVWPMYDFYNPIEDSLMGVTLILRSNEFDLRVELQDYIKDLLGLSKQKIIQYGRFNVIDFTTKGREIREMVESGELIGWDDPRLITLRALRRRGITKEAIYELVEQVGLSKHQVNLNFDMIAAINRKIIDERVNRYFFVHNPNKVRIAGAEELEIKIPLHPAFSERGFRKMKTGNEFYISSNDQIEKGKNYRLMHLFNFKDGKFASKELDETLKARMIHWLPVCKELIKVKVFMDDGKWISGFGEPDLKKVKVGEVVQFERFGFVKLDKKKKNEFEFWWTHK